MRNIRLMRSLATTALVGCGLFLAAAGFAAEETVTISKARLKQLEAAEQELLKLKGEYTNTVAVNQQLQKKYDQAEAKAAAAVAAVPPVHVSPPIDTLPVLAPDKVVEAMDLANYYKQDPKAADERFRKKRFRVQGEIIGFSKPIFSRPYKVILNSPDPKVRVSCEIWPPDKYQAIFTVNNGSELVGLIGQTRVPLLRVGNTVLLSGVCKGEKEGMVDMSPCDFVNK